MAIIGTPTTSGDDVVTVTPGAYHSVNGDAGNDLLVVDYGTLTTDVIARNIGYGWWRITDDFHTGVDYYNFERYDILTGSGNDLIYGREQDDRLRSGAGNDTIISGLGADTIDGGAGFDHWVGDYSSLNVNVSLILNPAAFATIAATRARIRGIEQVDLTTGSGADTLDVRATNANHTFNAGDGNDSFMVAGGRSTYNAGAGTDFLLADFSAATSRISMTNLGYGWWRVGDLARTMSVDFYSVDRFDFTGGSGSDTLSGGVLNDRLAGGAGNDWLNGVRGYDTIIGGDGTDTWEADYSAINTVVQVDLNAQTSNVASIAEIEAMRITGGARNDRLIAHAGRYNDTMNGGDGADVISTGRGVDQVNGGGGIDLLIMDWSALSGPTHGITYSNQGYGWYRYANATGDRLDFYSIEQFNLTGGAGNDHLVGWGNLDTLIGNDGNDTLSSDQGRATIDGGTGDDLWAANLTGINLAMAFSAKASQTTAQLAARGFSVRNIEQVSLELGAGNDNISTAGFALNDTVNSGGGNDTFNGGLGWDTFNGGAGTDLLVLDYSTLTEDILQSNQGYGWWRFSAQDNSHGVDYYAVERFNLTGGSGNDYLAGGALADTLKGGAGDDTLMSGTGGKDVVWGGAGIDTWNMDLSAATANLSLTLTAAGAGTLINNGTTLAGIENVQLKTGAGNDVLDFSAGIGNHVLSTGAGNDQISLGRGLFNEVNGGSGDDMLTFNASRATSGLRTTNEGYGWWSFKATDGSYKTSYYDIERLDITGSNFNDRLYGHGGNDVLRGGAGRDILNGFGGNDTLHGGAGADFFEFSSLSSSGVDLVADAETGDLLRFSGARINSFIAGDGSNVLQWQAQIQTANGITSIFLGLDGTAGHDFRVDLTGTFGVGSFSVVSYSDYTGGADLIVL